MARKSEQGFTLIEILVVLLITVILAAIALPLFINQRAKGQDADAKASASVVAGAMEVYHQDHDSFAGADVDALAQIEPTVRQARGLDIDSDAVSYTLAVDSASGNGPFTIERTLDETTRTCGHPGEGGCPENGHW